MLMFMWSFGPLLKNCQWYVPRFPKILVVSCNSNTSTKIRVPDSLYSHSILYTSYVPQNDIGEYVGVCTFGGLPDVRPREA